MALLSRRNRILLVKILALLSIVRWPNLLLTALAQYLAAIFVFNPESSALAVLQDTKLHFIVLATACILAAGFIINSFYDIEKDLVNRPHKTLFNRVISKSFCLRTYFVLNSIGLLFSAMGSMRILLFFSAFTFGLWFYSHKLQKIPLVREFSASLLSVAAFFSVGYHYNYVNTIIIIYAFIFLQILFLRELIKDFRHFEGDKVAGNQTILVVLGFNRSHLLYWILTSIFIVSVYLFYSGSYTQHKLVLMCSFVLIAITSGILIASKTPKGSAWAHRIWKLLLAAAILYLVFFRIRV